MNRQEHSTSANASGKSGRQPKRDPLQPEPGSLENQNVTRPAPIDQAPGEAARSGRPQPAGLEKQNVTQPAPPK